MPEDFRLQLRELRQTRDLSQEALAKALGISRQSIISLERGEYLPSFPLVIELIKFFQCPIDQLVEGLNWQSPPIKQITNEEGVDRRMNITPWNPFQAIDRMQEELDEVVDRTLGRADWSRMVGASIGALNIHEDDTEYELEVQVPGFAEADINIEASEDGVLTISGKKEAKKEESKKALVRREWEQAEFSRSIRFATPVAMDKIEAKLENGRLMLTAPKVQPVKPKTTKITVKKK